MFERRTDKMTKINKVLTVLVFLLLASVSVYAAEFNVTDFGAVADGNTDCAEAIQEALDAAGKAGGGKVIIPGAQKPYIVSKTVKIAYSHIELIGQGATLQLADYVLKNSLDDVLRIKGRDIKGIIVRGLTVDANYWNQNNTVEAVTKGKPRTKHIKPRGIRVEHVHNILLDNVHVKRAWVALAFSRGVVGGEARDCTVSQWHNDGFDAGNGAEKIHFLRCKAHNTYSNVEFPGSRDSPWEIEDGVKDITLTECVIENAPGGFKLRSHRGTRDNKPKINKNIRFIRCRGSFNIQGYNYLVRTEDVLLEDCQGGSVYCINGADDVIIKGGRFGRITLKWPRKLRIVGASANEIHIWAQERHDGKETFRPDITLENLQVQYVPLIAGDRSMVTIIGDWEKNCEEKVDKYFRAEEFLIKDRFKRHVVSSENVEQVIVAHKGKGYLLFKGRGEGFVIWKVKREAPIAKCTFNCSTHVSFKNDGRHMIFSVSTDEGKRWKDILIHKPNSEAASEVYGGGAFDISEHVKDSKQFLLRVSFHGGGRVNSIGIRTVPE